MIGGKKADEKQNIGLIGLQCLSGTSHNNTHIQRESGHTHFSEDNSIIIFTSGLTHFLLFVRLHQFSILI